MRLSFLLFLLILISFLLPSSVLAHGDEGHLTITLNKKQTLPNEISQDTESKKFIITEDIAPEKYHVNQPIVFEILHIESDNGQYSWKFSDGKTFTGDTITKSFTKPGSYTATLTKNIEKETITHTILVRVVPDETYDLPTAKITVNKVTVLPHETVDVNLNEPVSLSAENDRGGEFTYLWSFDNGDVLRGKTIEYEYKDHPFLATPILRVTDTNGLYTDMQVSLKNTQFGEKPLSTLWVAGGIILLIFLLLVGWVVIKRLKK